LSNFKEQPVHVSQHEFIFSNYWRHRAARHAAFLFACWLFFCISFYFPFKVLPGWNTENFTVNSARIGVLKWLWLRFVNSLLLYLPLVSFAYVVIYLILPRYIFDKRNPLTTTVMLAGLFLLVLWMQYAGGWLVAFNWAHAGPGRKMPEAKEIIAQNFNIILLNYPFVVGFAVIIKMMKRGWLKQQETLQLAREKAKAELQLLKSQIHPHFLFNTLNNVYFFTLTGSQKAPEMLEQLTDMLRYILNECNRSFVPLEKEIKMVQDYITLEKIRYGDRLKMDLEIKGDYRNKMIAPLLLIPLVENSFKHGASKMLEHPFVHLNITIDGRNLLFLLSNSRPDEVTLTQHKTHIGLNNVKKRLQLLYPATHELKIAESTGSFEVFMKISLEETNATEKPVTTETIAYALA
jgi:hypothetical protein